jgi:hypothetical protein
MHVHSSIYINTFCCCLCIRLGSFRTQVLKFALPTNDGIPRVFYTLSDVTSKLRFLLTDMKGSKSFLKQKGPEESIFKKKHAAAKAKAKANSKSEGKESPKGPQGVIKATRKAKAKPKASSKQAKGAGAGPVVKETDSFLQDCVNTIEYGYQDVKEEQIDDEHIEVLLSHCISFGLLSKVTVSKDGNIDRKDDPDDSAHDGDHDGRQASDKNASTESEVTTTTTTTETTSKMEATETITSHFKLKKIGRWKVSPTIENRCH